MTIEINTMSWLLKKNLSSVLLIACLNFQNGLFHFFK